MTKLLHKFETRYLLNSLYPVHSKVYGSRLNRWIDISLRHRDVSITCAKGNLQNPSIGIILRLIFLGKLLYAIAKSPPVFRR